MSTSTFSIVRAAHCSVVAVAWMKAIRAPKTCGTSYENKKRLSADKKPIILHECCGGTTIKRTCETLAKAELRIEELGIAAAVIPWPGLVLPSQQLLCKPRLETRTVQPWHKWFLLHVGQVAACGHWEPLKWWCSRLHYAKCSGDPPCLTGAICEDNLDRVLRYGGNLIFFLIFRNSCIIKHSYSWFTFAMQSTAKITTFVWSVEHYSNYVKM